MKLRKQMEYFAVVLFIISTIFMITAALIIRWGESKKVVETYENAIQANKKATEALALAQANAQTVGGFNTRLTAYAEGLSEILKQCKDTDNEVGEIQAHCIKLREVTAELREKIAEKDTNVTITLVEPTKVGGSKVGEGVKALIKDAAKKAKK